MPTDLQHVWPRAMAMLGPALRTHDYNRYPSPPKEKRIHLFRRETTAGIVSTLMFIPIFTGEGYRTAPYVRVTHRGVADLLRVLHPGYAAKPDGTARDVPAMISFYGINIAPEAHFKLGEPLDRTVAAYMETLDRTVFRFIDRHRTLADILDTIAEDPERLHHRADDLVIVAMLVLGEFDEARWMVGKERNRADLRDGSAYATEYRAFLRNVMAHVRRADRPAEPGQSGEGKR